MIPRETSQPSPVQDELRALLCVRSHGEQERVARVAGMCPRHLSNALNPDQPHALRPDQFVAIVRAGVELGVPGFHAYAEHLTTLLRPGAPCWAPNGLWSDEATEALCELSTLLRSHHRTPRACDLPAGAKAEVRAGALRCIEQMSALLRELEQ